VQKLPTQALPLQRLAPVGVRRAAPRVVPRRGRAVTDRFLRLAPRPQLDQRVNPGAQGERPRVGPDVPPLLLPKTFDRLQVVEVLLDTEAVRRDTQDLYRCYRGVGAEQRQPAVLLLHQHHPDAAPGGAPRRQERLDPLGPHLPVLAGLDYLPAALL